MAYPQIGQRSRAAWQRALSTGRQCWTPVAATRARPRTRSTAFPEAPPYPAGHPGTGPAHRPTPRSAALFHVKQPTVTASSGRRPCCARSWREQLAARTSARCGIGPVDRLGSPAVRHRCRTSPVSHITASRAIRDRQSTRCPPEHAQMGHVTTSTVTASPPCHRLFHVKHAATALRRIGPGGVKLARRHGGDTARTEEGGRGPSPADARPAGSQWNRPVVA
jgi:hypothetical protein